MNEALRLDYLQAMGVDSYVPRFVLEGAAPSPLCDIDFPVLDYEDGGSDSADSYDLENEYRSHSAQRDAEQSGSAVVAPLDKGQSRSRIAAELDGLNLDGKAQKRPTAAVKDDTSVTGDTAAQLNPEFSVDLVATNIGVIFIADTTKKPLNPAEKRLLANIAVAVKTHHKIEAAPSFSSAKFQWPVAKNLGLAQGVEAAKDALLGNVMAHAERQHAQYVVVFGDEIKPYFDHALLSSSGLNVVFSAAPTAMLADGSLKAALWQQLRQLTFFPKDAE